MAKYLIQGSYTSEGVKGLLKDGGSARRAAAEALINGLGGRVEAFYFGFGNHDAYVIADLPDNVTATAVSLTINATGVVTGDTTVLMTPEEVDEAVKKNVSYRPPGQ